ncbi:MAG: carbohydrate-binding domain-containing protein [Clostridia bacterium]|nr:carbohydrate-binding domain-containing protein [Clostridia bacterium]
MKKIRIVILLLALAVILSSCAVNSTESSSSATTADKQTVGTETTSTTAATEATTLTDPTIDKPTPTGTFSLTDENGNELSSSDNIYTITSAGEYTATGSLEEGQIVIDAGDDDKVTLNLDGASISNSADAPILALNASKVEVKAKKDTYNTVADNRVGTPSEDDADDNNGAIYAKCDLEISGKGTLVVTSSYDNGIKSKDDLEVKNLTLKVEAVGNALKGNDSVTVESGSIILVSTSSDGIKTSNTDVSSKGNQRGIVTVSGGQVDIYAACDGIDAAYDIDISGDETVVNIFTGKYSDYSGDVAASSEMYLIVPSGTYKSTYDYYGYFYNTSTDGKWVKFTFSTMVYSGRTSYYGLTANVPSGYSSMIINVVTSGQTPDGATYIASSDGENINTAMNGYLISSVTDKLISGDWVQISSSSGSSDKTTYSSKGIKAANSINVSAGTIVVKASDDGLHANGGDELENGSKGLGNITVDGGSVTVTSADDGFHADNVLTINGGYVNVAQSHEGLEGNVITINGGEVYVYGDDDGLNACKGNVTPLINITGGYLDVTTPSGDTDAIDSNGNITMSGGTVIVKGGSSSGMVSGSVDLDGTLKVTGGTIIALGGICETPTSGSVNTYISSGTSFSAGSYTLSDSKGNVIVTFTLTSSYSSCWISSDALTLNNSYTLTRSGTTVLSWTQSSSTVGSAGNSQGGWGSWGRGR